MARYIHSESFVDLTPLLMDDDTANETYIINDVDLNNEPPPENHVIPIILQLPPPQDGVDPPPPRPVGLGVSLEPLPYTNSTEESFYTPRADSITSYVDILISDLFINRQPVIVSQNPQVFILQLDGQQALGGGAGGIEENQEPIEDDSQDDSQDDHIEHIDQQQLGAGAGNLDEIVAFADQINSNDPTLPWEQPNVLAVERQEPSCQNDAYFPFMEDDPEVDEINDNQSFRKVAQNRNAVADSPEHFDSNAVSTVTEVHQQQTPAFLQRQEVALGQGSSTPFDCRCTLSGPDLGVYDQSILLLEPNIADNHVSVNQIVSSKRPAPRDKSNIFNKRSKGHKRENAEPINEEFRLAINNESVIDRAAILKRLQELEEELKEKTKNKEALDEKYRLEDEEQNAAAEIVKTRQATFGKAMKRSGKALQTVDEKERDRLACKKGRTNADRKDCEKDIQLIQARIENLQLKLINDDLMQQLLTRQQQQNQQHHASSISSINVSLEMDIKKKRLLDKISELASKKKNLESIIEKGAYTLTRISSSIYGRPLEKEGRRLGRDKANEKTITARRDLEEIEQAILKSENEIREIEMQELRCKNNAPEETAKQQDETNREGPKNFNADNKSDSESDSADEVEPDKIEREEDTPPATKSKSDHRSKYW